MNTPSCARLGIVQHGVEQGDGADAVVAGLGQVGGRDRGQRAAEAQVRPCRSSSAPVISVMTSSACCGPEIR